MCSGEDRDSPVVCVGERESPGRQVLPDGSRATVAADVRAPVNAHVEFQLADCMMLELAESFVSSSLIEHQRYGRRARMNTPSTLGRNWTWRLRPDYAGEVDTTRIADLTELYGRARIGGS